MSYLMNWGDRFISHHYVPVYWAQLGNALRSVYPSLGQNRNESIDSDMNDIQVGRAGDDVICFEV